MSQERFHLGAHPVTGELVVEDHAQLHQKIAAANRGGRQASGFDRLQEGVATQSVTDCGGAGAHGSGFPRMGGKGNGTDDAPDYVLALKQGFRGAVIGILDDDTLTLKAKVKQIGELLKTQEKLLAGDQDDDEDAIDDPDQDTVEEAQRRRRLGNLRGATPTMSDTKRSSLVESLRRVRGR